jgi:antitoxin component of RelBE/YafQ-DinJ toxin-antitoxin module
MTTQVVFNLDTKIKAKAMKRAKKKGIPFAAVLKLAATAFAEGRVDFDLVEEEVRPEKLKLWEKQSRLVEQGKGKRFNTIEEFRAYWRKL